MYGGRSDVAVKRERRDGREGREEGIRVRDREKGRRRGRDREKGRVMRRVRLWSAD